MTILNMSQLNDLLEMEKHSTDKIIPELVEIYIDQLEKFEHLAKKALAENNLGLLSDMAHSLKSSAGNLGMNQAHYLCLTIETDSRYQKNKDYELLIESLKTESKNAILEINKLIKINDK